MCLGTLRAHSKILQLRLLLQIATDATRVFIFNAKNPVSASQLCAVAILRRRWVSVRHACKWNQSITYMLQRFLFLIKWSGCSAWPACRLIALCNSSFQLLAAMHDFRDVFTPIVQRPRVARYIFWPSNALSLKSLWKEQRRNLTCKQPEIWCSFTMRPFRRFYSAVVMEHKQCRNLLT